MSEYSHDTDTMFLMEEVERMLYEIEKGEETYMSPAMAYSLVLRARRVQREALFSFRNQYMQDGVNECKPQSGNPQATRFWSAVSRWKQKPGAALSQLRQALSRSERR